MLLTEKDPIYNYIMKQCPYSGKQEIYMLFYGVVLSAALLLILWFLVAVHPVFILLVIILFFVSLTRLYRGKV
jgi:hypothetical protein